MCGSVGYVLIVSMTVAETDTVNGRDFGAIERHVRDLGVPFGIVRASLFMEDLLRNSGALARLSDSHSSEPAHCPLCAVNIRTKDAVYTSFDPAVKFAPVAVQDVGVFCGAQPLCTAVTANSRRFPQRTSSPTRPPTKMQPTASPARRRCH